MDLRASLLKLYFNVESAYYEFLDALDNHLPVYEYLVNPLENRGYPSFPVYCVVLLCVLFVLFFLSAGQQTQVGSLQLAIQDGQGRLISVARVDVVQNGATVASAVSDLGVVNFVGIPMKTPLVVRVQSNGYEAKSVSFDVFPIARAVVSLVPTSQTLAEVGQSGASNGQMDEGIEVLRSGLGGSAGNVPLFGGRG